MHEMQNVLPRRYPGSEGLIDVGLAGQIPCEEGGVAGKLAVAGRQLSRQNVCNPPLQRPQRVAADVAGSPVTNTLLMRVSWKAWRCGTKPGQCEAFSSVCWMTSFTSSILKGLARYRLQVCSKNSRVSPLIVSPVMKMMRLARWWRFP